MVEFLVVESETHTENIFREPHFNRKRLDIYIGGSFWWLSNNNGRHKKMLNVKMSKKCQIYAHAY